MAAANEKPKAGKAKAAAASLAFIALERLSDPQVRAQVAQQGRNVADLAKKWRDERRRNGEPATPGLPAFVGDRFGQRKLEKRVDRLGASLGDLSAQRPELAEPLAGVASTLQEIRSALTIAGDLPLAKRKRAHVRIDHELDRLEQSVFETLMPVSE